MMEDYFTDWYYGKGQFVKISEMDDYYIGNCVRRIEEGIDMYINRRCEYSGSNDPSEIYSKAWILEYGEKYLCSFQLEIEIRNRIKRKDYPRINVEEVCKNCRNFIGNCSMNPYGACDNWSISACYVQNFLCNDYVSYEVAMRAGCYINNILYKE